MIPIAVEPTRLAFGVYCKRKGISSTDTNTFRKFSSELRALFSALDTHTLGIASTRSLFGVFQAQVPFAECGPGASPLFRLAADTFGRQLRTHILVVHEYGSHSLEVELNSGIRDPLGLLSSDNTYLEWLDLLGNALIDRLPHFILRDSHDSVFAAQVCTLAATNESLTCEMNVSEGVDNDTAAAALSPWRLAELMARNTGASSELHCASTGTHSSMWGHHVTSLQDVPASERELLGALAMCRLISGVVLRDFPRRCQSTNVPFIELQKPTPSEATLQGVLRGKGTKQHGQHVSLHLSCGTPRLVFDAFKGRIDRQGIERLRRIAEHLKNRQR